MNPGAVLDTLPPESVDQAWIDRLRAIPLLEQQAWIRAADAIVDRDDESEWRAQAVYLALRDHLRPDSEQGVARTLSLLRSSVPRDMDHLGFASRLIHCEHRTVRHFAALLLIEGHIATQAYDNADREIGALLREVAGSGSEVERRGLACLAMVCLAQGRDFESFVLAQRARRMGEARGAPQPYPLLFQAQSEVYRMLDADETRDEVVREFARALRRSPAPWNWRYWYYVHAVRAEAAIESKQIALARGEVGRMRAVVPAGAMHPLAPIIERQFEAMILLAVGQPGQALELVPNRALPVDFTGLILSVQCALGLGDAPLAVERAREVLEQLRAQDGGRFGPASALRLTVAAKIGGFLDDAGIEPDLVTESFELASQTLIERVGVLQHWIRRAPELAELHPQDTRLLERHRARYIGQNATFLSRLIPHLRRHASELGPFVDTLRGDDFLRVCAWCHRVRESAEGPWLPIGQYIPDEPEGLRITHGVCAACRSIVSKDEVSKDEP